MKTYKLLCVECGKCFNSTRFNKKTCSVSCDVDRSKKLYGTASTGKLPLNITGRLSEYAVVIDLTERGYDVYISSCFQSKYDLMALDRLTEETLKIEVKTGYRLKSNKITKSKHRYSNYDVLAVVVREDKTIHYFNQKGSPLVLNKHL